MKSLARRSLKWITGLLALAILITWGANIRTYNAGMQEVRRAFTRGDYSGLALRKSISWDYPDVSTPDQTGFHLERGILAIEHDEPLELLIGGVDSFAFPIRYRHSTYWSLHLAYDFKNWKFKAFIMPLWIPAALLSIACGVLTWRDGRPWRRSRNGFCPKCNYDRAGLAPAASCPECGT